MIEGLIRIVQINDEATIDCFLIESDFSRPEVVDGLLSAMNNHAELHLWSRISARSVSRSFGDVFESYGFQRVEDGDSNDMVRELEGYGV